MPSRPAEPAAPRPSTLQTNVVCLCVVIVAAVFALDIFDIVPRTFGMVAAITGAAIAAMVVYAFWAGAHLRTVPMHLALVAALLGGTGITAGATAGTDRVFASTMVGALGVAGLILAAVALMSTQLAPEEDR